MTTAMRIALPADVVARLDRLRRGAVPFATRRTALARQLVLLGLAAAEQDPRRLVGMPPSGAPITPTTPESH
ncbi:MAG: hypothetical protein M9894_14855 [Planctomycetes bacterium]|nr:hypothetical protein [Planctomycetota bacterium]